MKSEDFIGSWISKEIIHPDGQRAKRPIKSKLEINVDGTAILKTGFLKSKDSWREEGGKLVLHNIGFDADMGSLVIVDDEMHLVTDQGTICVYTRD